MPALPQQTPHNGNMSGRPRLPLHLPSVPGGVSYTNGESGADSPATWNSAESSTRTAIFTGSVSTPMRAGCAMAPTWRSHALTIVTATPILIGIPSQPDICMGSSPAQPP